MDTPHAVTSEKVTIVGAFSRIGQFYAHGFRSMVLGKTLWKIIALKLIIMFGVLKLFFFPDFLASTYGTDEERAGHVLEEITAMNHSTTAIVVPEPMKAVREKE